jgi:Tol biopolymer transport system component
MLRSDGHAWSTSPDGSLIAFTSPTRIGREIWLIGPDGEEPRRLTLADDGARTAKLLGSPTENVLHILNGVRPSTFRSKSPSRVAV